jgi:uncharacterized protein Veg
MIKIQKIKYNLGSIIILRGNQGRDSRKTKEKILNL